MQRTLTMPVTETIITSAVSAAVGWLVASVTKVSKVDYKELIQRVNALEKDLTGRMTRTEFEQAFNKIEAMVLRFQLEARAEFKDLKRELQTKT